MKKTVAILFCTGFAGAAIAAEDALKVFLERATSGLEGRVEISVGSLDPRTRPAPCARVEPFIAAGTRLWGRTAIGMRCADGAAWSTFVPVEVRVFAPAWVSTRPLPAGHSLLPGDVRQEEVDLTRHAAGLLREPPAAAERVLARALAGGQALREDHFRPVPAIAAGDRVRAVYAGEGFSVSTEARALAPAALGQPVRVQTDSGRVLSGIARAGRQVEMRF